MSMPSLNNSPWMRGAPQIGFSRLILRISCRISLDTGGRPGWPRRTFQVQNNRNPLRCQPMTVSGSVHFIIDAGIYVEGQRVDSGPVVAELDGPESIIH